MKPTTIETAWQEYRQAMVDKTLEEDPDVMLTMTPKVFSHELNVAFYGGAHAALAIVMGSVKPKGDKLSAKQVQTVLDTVVETMDEVLEKVEAFSGALSAEDVGAPVH